MLVGGPLWTASGGSTADAIRAPAWLGGEAAAQTLDVVVDGTVASGVALGQGDDGTAVGRTPLLVELEAGFIFDGDRSVEWVLGSIIQLEDTPGVGLVPQVRLLAPFGVVDGFVSAGVPAYLFPFTRFGLEIGGGALFPVVPDRFALVGQLAFDVFFGGSDVPADTTVLMFNLGLGGRVYF